MTFLFGVDVVPQRYYDHYRTSVNTRRPFPSKFSFTRYVGHYQMFLKNIPNLT